MEEQNQDMAVIKSKRKESCVKFIDKARELEEYTIEQCTKFPKRHTFSIANPLIDLAREIYNYTIKANATFPSNEALKQKKLEYLSDAFSTAQCFGAQLEIAKTKVQTFGDDVDKGKPIKDNVWEHWASLVDDVTNLLYKTKKSLEEKYIHTDNTTM